MPLIYVFCPSVRTVPEGAGSSITSSDALIFKLNMSIVADTNTEISNLVIWCNLVDIIACVLVNLDYMTDTNFWIYPRKSNNQLEIYNIYLIFTNFFQYIFRLFSTALSFKISYHSQGWCYFIARAVI